MGTEIQLKVGGISLSYAKNGMGIDHGFLFQEDDRSRCRADNIDYNYYAEQPDEEYLAIAEAAFIRPLHLVLPRLDLIGFTLDAARAEYEALIGEDKVSSASEDAPDKSWFSFDEFCDFCGRFPLDDLDDRYVEYDAPDRDVKIRGRFAGFADEFARIPPSYDNQYWSERSFFGASITVLSCYAMLQVLGRSSHHIKAPVIWQYGPLVHAGWEDISAFQGGAPRDLTMLVATEGSSDVSILKRALTVLHPEIADFFRFIDGEERHHFWGTGALAKFAEGLVRIDIQNKVIFVLDNDAEGLEAFNKLAALRMSPNMRAMTLPELDRLRRFPARGPEGVQLADINRRAAGIECYLDLNLPDCPAAQIIWTNYKPGLDSWHGALAHKEIYARHFYNQDDGALLDGLYEVSGLVAILDTLCAEATKLMSMAAHTRAGA